MSLIKNLPSLKYSDYFLKDISKRIAIANEIKNDPEVYQMYELQTGETAESIAQDFYNDPTLYWLIYLMNDIIDPFYGWLLTEEELKAFIDEKHIDPLATHHIETDYDTSNDATLQITPDILLHFDGTVGDSGSFVNSGTYNVSWINPSASIQLQNTQVKFGSTALEGSYGAGLITEIDDTPGNFTFEGWFYPTTIKTQPQGIFGWKNGSSATPTRISLINGVISYGAASHDITNLMNSWLHVAFVSIDGEAHLYINGVKSDSSHSNTIHTYTNGTLLSIGGNQWNSSEQFVGYIDEVRASFTEAIYTEDFTAPSAPFLDQGLSEFKETTITNTDFEESVNESKRKIKIIRPKSLRTIKETIRNAIRNE